MDSATQSSLRIARVSIGAGLFLAVVKITVGILANSLAVIADGIESAGDVVASVILWLGLNLSAQPPDEDHPYGHGRFEILAGQAIGAFLIATGTIFAWQAILHARKPQTRPEAFAIWTLILSTALKLALARWKQRASKQFHSAALSADAANDWLDVLSGTIAILALGLNINDPITFSHADSIGGLLIAVLVVFLGFQVLRQSSRELLDTMPSQPMLDAIRACALSVPDALGIEKCRARKTGLGYHVDFHLEVDPQFTVERAHHISGAVRSAIRSSIPWVADVLIHIEPAPSSNGDNRVDG
ncbi:MAG: cation transporter [Acidobacteria bacterium]|nr:cation transporter [Acidobacteriota bacterium]